MEEDVRQHALFAVAGHMNYKENQLLGMLIQAALEAYKQIVGDQPMCPAYFAARGDDPIIGTDVGPKVVQRAVEKYVLEHMGCIGDKAPEYGSLEEETLNELRSDANNIVRRMMNADSEQHPDQEN